MRWLIAVALLLPLAAEAKRSYRYMLDPAHAEETLSNIALNGRMTRDEWMDLVSYRRDDEYTVRPGDTLWSIAQKSFGDPYLWRKLWEVNEYLTNPHVLETGQLLKYYREGADSAGLRIPLVKLVPNNGSAVDIDADAYIHRPIRNQFRPRVFMVRNDEFLGQITGSYADHGRLSELEQLYLDFYNGSLPKEGSQFAIVKVLRETDDAEKEGQTVSGSVVRLVGLLKIIETGKRLARAELTRHSGIVERGDKLIAVPKVIAPGGLFNPPDDLRLRIAAGEEEGKQIFSQGDIVLLDKGAADGVKQGFMFRIYRDEDTYMSSKESVEPDSKGDIQIISVSEFGSVGLVVRNKEPLLLADELVPVQMFRDAPPPPSREVQSIEIE